MFQILVTSGNQMGIGSSRVCMALAGSFKPASADIQGYPRIFPYNSSLLPLRLLIDTIRLAAFILGRLAAGK